MPDSLLELLVLFIIIATVVGIFTLMGHMMWLFAAGILRALFGIGRNPATNGYRCPACGMPDTLIRGTCRSCRYQTVAAQNADLENSMLLLQSLRTAGKITDAQLNAVMPALRAEAKTQQMTGGLSPGYEQKLSPFVAPAEPALPPETPSAASPTATPPPEALQSPTAARADSAPPSEPDIVILGSSVDSELEDEILDAEIVDSEVVEPAPASPPGRRVLPPAPPVPHPLDAPEPEPTAAAPAAFSPRQTMADMLQSFMEEKNIRWGELASGMLIVGSAIGLVVSLRVQLQRLSDQIPYFPALLLMLGTVAIHAAGLYTLRRWKLRSTSRGVLIIATLLVPLSFAAGILLSGTGNDRPAATSLFYLAAVTVGMLGYGTITSLSARALFPEGWWRLAVAVMGTSAGQLIINRQVNDESPSSLAFASAVFALPLVSYLVATLSQLQVLSTKKHLTPVRASQTFTVLGISAFSLAVPLVLQAVLSQSTRDTIAALSPSLSMAAAVVLGIGIAVQRRCESQRMGATRTAGTALALLGGMAMVGTVLAAWPNPITLVAVAIVASVILLLLAVLGRLPILHAGTVAAAAFAVLLLVHYSTGQIQQDARGIDLVRAAVMGRSAFVLLIPTAIAGGVGLALVLQKRRQDGLVYLASSLGVAASSLAIALYSGFISRDADANWVTLLLLVYAVGALASISIVRKTVACCVGSAVLLVALVHLFAFNTWFPAHLGDWARTTSPWMLAALVHGAIVSGYGLVLHVIAQKHRLKSDQPADSTWLHALFLSGAATAALAVPFILYVPASSLGTYGIYAACVALIWGTAAFVIREPHLFSAAYGAGSVAIGFVTAGFARNQEWPHGLDDLRHWQLQLTVLSIWCALATGIRLLTRKWRRIQEVIQPAWPTVDQLLLGTLLAALVFVAATGCGTGVFVELGIWDVSSAAAQDTWHSVAYAWGSWFALACVVAALLLLLSEKVTATRFAGLITATAVIPLLVSGRFEDVHAVASALRWSSAVFTIVWIAATSLRDPILRVLTRAIPTAADGSDFVVRTGRDIASVVGVGAVTALTSMAFVQFSQGVALQGPTLDSWLGSISSTALYATPLALLVAGLLWISVRDGSALYAFVASLLLQYVVALAILLPAVGPGNQWTVAVAIALIQWSACALGAYSLVWLALAQWIERQVPSEERWLLKLQLVAATAVTLVLAIWAAGAIFTEPWAVKDAAITALGQWPSYLAAGLTSLAGFWCFRHSRRDLALLSVIVPCGFGCLAAATASMYDAANLWLSYHVLTTIFTAIPLAAAAMVWWHTQQTDDGVLEQAGWLSDLTRAGNAIAIAACIFVVRGCIHDPLVASWTIGISAALFTYFAAQGLLSRKQSYAYLSAFIGLFATTVVWCHLSRASDEQFLYGLLHSNVIVACLIGLFWLLVDLRFQRTRGEPMAPRFPLAPIHSLLALASTALMLMFALGGTSISTSVGLAGVSDGLVIANAWSFTALAMLGLLLVGLLWEQRFGLNLVAGYLWGFVAIALMLNVLQNSELLGPRRTEALWVVVVAGLAGAAYVAITGHLWKWGANIAQQATRWSIPQPVEKLDSISRWLPAFNLIATFVICALGFLTIFAQDSGISHTVLRAMRMTVAFAPILLAYGVSCLAQQHRKFAMQCLALLLVVVGAAFIGWADIIVAAGDARILAYCARLLIVLAGMTLAYSLVVTRWIGETHDWFAAVRQSGVYLACATSAVLLVVLGLEVAYFRPDTGAPISLPEAIAVAVMLLGFIVALLVIAVLPGRDPLALSEKGRQGYVYAAQVMAAVLFGHAYLAVPELFQFGLMKFWPYIVMAIAFASVAVAEFCFRKGWRVIAEPMQRTGGFLPLLPALTAWTFATSSSYPLTLFFGGLIYVFMSVTRRSFVAGIAAAVMGNGALWALFMGEGMRLADQPQLWMIPPALSVLGASYINRDRLSDNALTAIRYICVMIIYLSSTGEMFMKLMTQGGNWAGPMILTGLSVAGVFAGILLRVRAFLYLGSSFLLMSIVGMVWNATLAVHHVWPWWAFGISLGLGILVLFGLFEKHRQEMKQLVIRLRQWEP